MHIIVEKVLQSRHFPQRFELLAIALLFLGRLLWLRLGTDARDAFDSLDLVLGVEGCLSLVIPELPGCLTAVPVRG